MPPPPYPPTQHNTGSSLDTESPNKHPHMAMPNFYPPAPGGYFPSQFQPPPFENKHRVGLHSKREGSQSDFNDRESDSESVRFNHGRVLPPMRADPIPA